MNAAEIRAARALLDWSPDRLAAEAGVDAGVLREIEHDTAAGSAADLIAIRAVLKSAGVQLIDGGVALRPAGSVEEMPGHRSIGPEDEDRAGPEAPRD
jgi:transcriptional regulator with XRE-family HTH domain